MRDGSGKSTKEISAFIFHAFKEVFRRFERPVESNEKSWMFESRDLKFDARGGWAKKEKSFRVQLDYRSESMNSFIKMFDEPMGGRWFKGILKIKTPTKSL